MIPAYNEVYLSDSMRILGEAFDYAFYDMAMPIDEFFQLFIATHISSHYEKGHPKFVTGMSGNELALEVVENSNKSHRISEPIFRYDQSKEYWCGWILAYYQWKSNIPFSVIASRLSMEKLSDLYYTLHEVSEEKAFEVIDSIVKGNEYTTRLCTLRKAAGYSQSELSIASGVSLRMIQQYEQRAKDINKATATNLRCLAIALGCTMEDLLEV